MVLDLVLDYDQNAYVLLSVFDRDQQMANIPYSWGVELFAGLQSWCFGGVMDVEPVQIELELASDADVDVDVDIDPVAHSDSGMVAGKSCY